MFNFLHIRTWTRIDDRNGCLDMGRGSRGRSKTATPAYKREKKTDS